MEGNSAEGTQYTLSHFVARTAQQDRNHGVFELESPYALEVNLSNHFAWIKTGSMVAYRGNIKFSREGMLEHGLGKALKKFATGEGATLTKAEGTGKLYVADRGKKIFILKIQPGESIVVNGNDILAFEGDGKIDWDIKLMRIAAMAAGGLTNIRLWGDGMIALSTHYDPLTLRVTPGSPLYTDPNATVAWSGTLSPELKFDVSMRTFLGRGSGESVQMEFVGDGFVVVQPYEEVYYPSTPS